MTLDNFQKQFRLTMRERQLCGLLGVGSSQKEASQQMGISVATINFHLRHIKTKLQEPTTSRIIAKVARQVDCNIL